MLNSEDLLEALDIAVYTTDAEGRITFFNSAAAALWGYQPELGSLWCGSWRILTLDGEVLPHDQCPMAIALKEGRPVRGVEAIAERPDGTQVPFQPFPTPLYDKAGRLIGGINLLVNLTERKVLDEESQRLAAIVTSSDDAMVSKTLDGRIMSWNAGAARIFGYQPHEMIGQSITKIIPPELHGEEKDILARLSRGERIDHYETTRVTKDGRRVSISLTVSPIRDKLGRVVGASKVGRDITEKKQAEDLQRLLINELNHRIKNTLATVQAIATQTLRRAPTPASFVSGFSGRIQALSRAHSLLTCSTFQGAELSQLMREQLLLGGADDSRISLSGPPVVLGAQTSVHLALVFHELGTNARKHGALSTPTGNVSVDWEMTMGEGRMLVIDWRERGGPSVEAPMKEGFGTTLIDQSLKAHGGEVSMRYGKVGLTCSILLPLSETIQAVGLPPAYGERQARPGPSPRAQRKLPLSGRRILIVEDEAIVAMSLADDIADMGGEAVGPVSTPDEAMQAIEKGGFDIVLLDANLSGRPVGDVAAALTRRNVPFVFISGYGREGLPVAFQHAAIVEKPFTPAQILAALERLLEPSNIVDLKQKPAQSA